MMNLRKFLFLLFLLCSQLFAQDFNVKLKKDANLVYQWKNFNQFKTKFSNISQVKQLSPKLEHWFTVSMDSNALTSLKNHPEIEWIEPNYSRKCSKFQQDPDLSQQTYHDQIQTFAAWDSSTAQNVIVGVIDTGLDYFHPEFDGQLWINSLEDFNQNGSFEPWSKDSLKNGILGDFDGIDNDQNGYIDDVCGYDFTDQPRLLGGGDYLFQDPNPYDDNQHGTLVSGIIAAKRNNGTGGVGIAPNSKIMVIRAFAGAGVGEDDDIARAIIYATDNGVQVLNFSFGDIYPSQVMQEAIRYAYSKNVVMIGSAGNGTGDNLHYPSNFPEVISVSASASDASGNEFLWPLSSYGLRVSLCAPGANIFCPTRSDTAGLAKYDFFSGTSTAAPMVSSAAALLLAKYPDLKPAQIRGILCSTADDLSDNGWDLKTGAGRLNLKKAFERAYGSWVEILNPFNDAGTNQNQVLITGSILHPELQFWKLGFYSGDQNQQSIQWLVNQNDNQILADTLAIWNVQNLTEGIYTLVLQAHLRNGKTVESRIRFLIQRTKPKVEISFAGEAWEENQKKYLINFRSSQVCRARLVLSQNGKIQTFTQDKLTKNGFFLIKPENGNFDFSLIVSNAAELKDTITQNTVIFSSKSLLQVGYEKKNYKMPAGFVLNQIIDSDNNGQKDIIISKYDSLLNYGKILRYNFQNNQFSATDSINQPQILLPKDLKDVQNDGIPELLCNIRDSIYVFSQTTGKFQNTALYSNFAQNEYPALFYDTDNDGLMNLITKDFRDYFVYEWNGTTFIKQSTLADTSSDYIGSTAPRVQVADMDQDGLLEIWFGDYDGDIHVFESQGNNQYARINYLSGSLQKSSDFLQKADIDGDGTLEMFSASYTSFLRNDDFEYNTAWIQIKIWSSIADNQFVVSDSFAIFNRNSDEWNTVQVADLNQDGKDEILLSVFPKLYILGFSHGKFDFQTFMYGSIQNSIAVADWDANGFQEFSVLEDSIVWYEKIPDSSPLSVAEINGKVTGNQSIRLDWLASPDATEYIIWKTKPGDSLIYAIASTSQTFFTEDTLSSGTEYIYAVTSKNTSFSPQESQFFSNIVFLKPGNLFKLLQAQFLSPKTLSINFDAEIAGSNEQMPLFQLDGKIPASLSAQGKNAILGFEDSYIAGNYLLTIDSSLSSIQNVLIDPNNRTLTVNWVIPENQTLFLSKWYAESPTTAILEFNQDIFTNQDSIQLSLETQGKIISVNIISSNKIAVELSETRLGAVGFDTRIRVLKARSLSGSTMQYGFGDLALFETHTDDLSNLLTAPNPAILEKGFMRFIQLPAQAKIEIFSQSGNPIKTLEENDGDGGIEWNFQDYRGKTVAPGVYLYRVSTDNVHQWSSFTVIK